MIKIYLSRLGEPVQKRAYQEDDGYPCNFCNIVYSKAEDLISHNRCHVASDTLRCHVCLHNFPSLSLLKRHMLQTHGHQYKQFCFECGRAFSGDWGLNAHNRLFHRPEAKSLICTVCRKIFSFDSQLQVHLKKHSDDQPYFCEICGRTYKYKRNLKQHTCSHMCDTINNKYKQN